MRNKKKEQVNRVQVFSQDALVVFICIHHYLTSNPFSLPRSGLYKRCIGSMVYNVLLYMVHDIETIVIIYQCFIGQHVI